MPPTTRCCSSALKDGGANFRGVAVVTSDMTDAELQRCTTPASAACASMWWIRARPKASCRWTQLRELASRVKPFGWHMEFLAHVNEFPDLDRLFAGFPVDVVFGHLGYVPTGEGTERRAFRPFCGCLRTGAPG